jgi:hypothetical protein
MKKIVIFGDSWGCGEWCNITHKVIHNGISQYFSESGHIVYNHSIPGGSIINVLGVMNDYKQLINDSDIVLYFQTDPIRNLRPFDDKTFDSFRTYDSLKEKQTQIIDWSYNELNSFTKKIYCIGGATKLNLELIKKYDNLYPFLESITEFLLPNFKHPTFWMSDWNNFFGEKLDLEELDKFLNDKINQDSLLNYKEFFWPDGSHPNRYGHKLIYNKICDFLKI